MSFSETGPSRTTNGGTWRAVIVFYLHWEASYLRVRTTGRLQVTDGFSSNQHINWSSSESGSGQLYIGTVTGYWDLYTNVDTNVAYGSSHTFTLSLTNGGQTSSASYTIHAESLDSVESQVAAKKLTLSYGGHSVDFVDYSLVATGTNESHPDMWAVREGAQFADVDVSNTDFSDSSWPITFCSEDFVYVWVSLVYWDTSYDDIRIIPSFKIGEKSSGSNRVLVSFFSKAEPHTDNEINSFSAALATLSGHQSEYVSKLKYYTRFGNLPYRGPTKDSKGREYFTYNDVLVRVHGYVQHYDDTEAVWDGRYFYFGFALFNFDQFAYAFNSSGSPVKGKLVVVDPDGSLVPVDVYVYDADGVPRTAL